MSKAEKKNQRRRSPSICRTQWPAGTEMRLYPGKFHRDTERYFRKTEEQFSKRIVFAKLIDNQSPLYITKFQRYCQAYNTLVPQWYHRPLGGTKVVDSILRYVDRWVYEFLRICLVFFSQNIICAWPQDFGVSTLHKILLVSSRESICGPSGSEIDIITTWRHCMFWNSFYVLKSDLGSLISMTYYRSKRFFSIF